MSASTETGTVDAAVDLQAEKVKEYVKDLKNRICRMYGREILELPSMREPLPKIMKSDSPEVRQVKERDRNRILRLRDAEYDQKFEEVVDRLDEVIKRVRGAIRDEKMTSKSIFSGNNQHRNAELQLRMSRDSCPLCGNKVWHSATACRQLMDVIKGVNGCTECQQRAGSEWPIDLQGQRRTRLRLRL